MKAASRGSRPIAVGLVEGGRSRIAQFPVRHHTSHRRRCLSGVATAAVQPQTPSPSALPQLLI